MLRIVGIQRPCGGQTDCGSLDALTQLMRHEPFYNSGVYSNDELGLALGWTGFSAGPARSWPYWSQDRTLGLILSGELFPSGGESGEAVSQGHRGGIPILLLIRGEVCSPASAADEEAGSGESCRVLLVRLRASGSQSVFRRRTAAAWFQLGDLLSEWRRPEELLQVAGVG